MTKVTLFTSALCLASSLSLHAASVSFNIGADILRDSNGDAMPLNGVIFLVASTTDTNFGAVLPGSYDVGDFLGGGDDVILYRTDLNANGAPGLLFETASGIVLDDTDNSPGLVPNLSAGDPLALYWFPTSDNNAGSGSVSLAAGAQGNLYRSDTGLDGSRAWTMPASGTHDLNFFTSDSLNLPGSNDPALANAIDGFVAVPEPSATLLFGIAVFAFGARRRR